MKIVSVALVVLGLVLICGGYLQWYAAQDLGDAVPLLLANDEQAAIDFVPRVFTNTECSTACSYDVKASLAAFKSNHAVAATESLDPTYSAGG